MKRTIEFTAAQWAQLEAHALKGGYASATAYAHSRLFPLNAKTIELLLEDVKVYAEVKNSGDTFRVRDLFPKDEWELMPFGVRKALGKMLYKVHKQYGFKHLGKGSDGHTRYEKA